MSKPVNFHLKLDNYDISKTFHFGDNETDEEINEKFMEWMNQHLEGYWSFPEEDAGWDDEVDM